MRGMNADQLRSISLAGCSCNLAVPPALFDALQTSLQPYVSHGPAVAGDWTISSSQTSCRLGEQPDFHDDLGSRMFVDADARSVHVVNPEFDHLVLSTARQIRGVLRLQHYAADGLSVHGAMVVRDSAGILLVGEKRAGKTSLMLALLQDSNWSFVCNDDTTLHPTPEGFVGNGWPRAIRVRRETLFLLEALCRARGMDCKLSHPDNPGFAIPNALNGIERDVLLVLPREIAAIAGSVIVPNAPVQLVVFPTVQSNLTESVEILPIDRDEGERRLLSCIAPFTSLAGGKFLPHLRPHFAVPGPERVRDALARHASAIRYVELRHSFATIHTAPTELLNWLPAA